jgi:hypothetical protein
MTTSIRLALALAVSTVFAALAFAAVVPDQAQGSPEPVSPGSHLSKRSRHLPLARADWWRHGALPLRPSHGRRAQ